MNEDHQTDLRGHRIDPYEDEVELMDYLLVIWKWKHLILAGTLAFGFAAAIMSFITLKQQSTMYRTNIVLKPGILKIDEQVGEIFVDTPENIKTLIQNDLEYKILDDIKSSKRTFSSNSLNFQVEIPKGSNKLNVFLESASVEDGATKLNYLIKALSEEFTDKTKFIQEEYEKQIEDKKYEIKILLLEKKEIKTKIKKYEKELSEIESIIINLKDNKDVSQSKEYLLNKLSIENDYRNTFQTYFEEKQYAKYNLFEVLKKINELSKEIELDIQTIKVIQPPVTKELPKENKIMRNVILSSTVGLFMMLFLSFFLEYLNKYKKREQ